MKRLELDSVMELNDYKFTYLFPLIAPWKNIVRLSGWHIGIYKTCLKSYWDLNNLKNQKELEAI